MDGKIMKKIIFTIFLLTTMCFASILDTCFKYYTQDADSVFLSALSALGSNSKYNISEIQSANGYIVFYYNQKCYLLVVTKKYRKTEVKILPQNSDYSQSSVVSAEIFKLLDNEIKKPMGLVK